MERAEGARRGDEVRARAAAEATAAVAAAVAAHRRELRWR